MAKTINQILEVEDRIYEQAVRLHQLTGVAFNDALSRTAACLDDPEFAIECGLCWSVFDDRVEHHVSAAPAWWHARDGDDYVRQQWPGVVFESVALPRSSPWQMPEPVEITDSSALRRPIGDLPNTTTVLEMLGH